MLSAATAYLFIEILSPDLVGCFFLAYKMLPMPKGAALVRPHQRGEMLLAGSSPYVRCDVE